VKGQGHQATLFIAALTRQAAAAVSVGTYWPIGDARLFGAHRGRRGAGAYRGGSPPTAC